MSTELILPPARVARWVANFADRHGTTTLGVAAGALHGTAEDGSTFEAVLPFAAAYDSAAEVDAFLATLRVPARWGVLLVRKGGFAIARLEGERLVESKVGQRHVQGRTKAGGQSQQRFARRRDNQARQAYEAAAGHAARILTGPLEALVTGGDHAAVEAVLEDQRLRHLAERVVPPWFPVPDPRRAVLDATITDASSVRMRVVNAG
ncbi:acVLRF1 family peptidyl-tRNA hydrolase [Nocardioides sp.]|uniref:acVLRF1 family peptidyl-tRNA hydrolase n=1 Tax=Nocardioides sp. TaxID=35761 RepID=UPI0027373CA3|nr:acVLRF1 family peptidyl-tRNA hydrolase [Nocardioides sp.]MDP3894857.1 acVLRF1 family peptidyl-tRNA hydrolase [Nocardioides sp.]